MGSLYLRNHVWYINYRFQGRRLRKAIGPDKKLAETVLKKIEVEIAEGKHLDKMKEFKATSFPEMADLYLEWSKANKRSWDRDRRTLKHLNAFFGKYNLHEITPFFVEKYKNERRKNVSPRTVNLELACLRHMFTKALQWELVKDNPVKKVKQFKVNNARVRFLSTDEKMRLREVAGDRLWRIILIAMHTGIRKNALLLLKTEDLNFDRGSIHVSGSNSKNGCTRDIPMTQSAREALEKLREESNSEYVFTQQKDPTKRLRCVRTIFIKSLDKAHIKNFKWHDLRHTFASDLVMAGADLRTVGELLGHKTLAMTLRYAHLSPEHKRKAIQLLDSEKIDTNGLKMATNLSHAQSDQRWSA